MIKDRVIQVIENKGIKKGEFYNKIGMTSANFRGSAKRSPLNSNAIENILSEIEDINPRWLITGEGQMFIGSPQELHESESGLPLIPVHAMAGFGTGDNQVMDYDTVKYKVPEFTELNAEFMIRVKGSSMYPKYNSGDLLACKKITMSFFQWNKVYVLDTEQGALIKRIKPSKDNDFIQCVSDNENYAPFDLPKCEVNALAIVLGVIRLE